MNLTFRRVTSDDFDDVIAIRRGIYYGLDYLAGRYHSMLRTHQGYVAMDGDKMVGFACLTSVDDGTTSLIRAARVHEDYEGKGVYRGLTDYIRQIVSTNQKLKRSAVAIHLDTDADRLIKKGAVFIGKRNVRVFVGTATSTLSKITRIIENKPLNRDALSRIFTCTNLCSNLFPTERIVCNWVAYRLVPSNLEYFYSDHHNVIGTSVDPEDLSGQPLLSVGMSFKCDIGDELCIDFHGNIGEGSKLKEHVEKHIKLSIGQQVESIIIMVTFDAVMDNSLLYKTMGNLTLEEKNIGVSMNMIEESI
ncbi:histidine N-acetyltransferase-like [Pecten maximus]|uniref:histidine N-acetyltransferase-like n=1 Tax=Pecten maximus TaxID=6579 RepID=UPI0014589C49|nr:histidine N-acetyltransferase-like [Pecten maximus]